MTPSLSASEAARRLGVSPKALRLYEKHALLKPARSAAGWRIYGPDQIARATDIVTLRKLGFSLARIGRILAGEVGDLDTLIAVHQAAMEGRLRGLGEAIQGVRALRERLARGETPSVAALRETLSQTTGDRPRARPAATFDLPWPWGGERFELPALGRLAYIVGPLGSGKTRLAMHIADAIPGAAFLGLDRARDPGAVQARLAADPGLRSRVEDALAWLIEDGASASNDLAALLVALEDGSATALVIDLIEHELDEATQQALAALLRRRDIGARPLVMMTRSTAILDLADTDADTLVIFCPANHSPPVCVSPYPGAAGYEALASCLAAPSVRARTRGMVARMTSVT